jgi:hypothetical protein
MSKPSVMTEANRKKLVSLHAWYQADSTYRALVDMYRNVNFEPETAAYFMAAHDMAESVRQKVTFSPILVGYDDRELEFLTARGVAML